MNHPGWKQTGSFNDIQTTGVYFVTDKVSDAPPVTNTNWFVLFCMGRSDTTTQLAMNIAYSGYLYYRNRTSNVWNSWKLISTKEDNYQIYKIAVKVSSTSGTQINITATDILPNKKEYYIIGIGAYYNSGVTDWNVKFNSVSNGKLSAMPSVTSTNYYIAVLILYKE